MTDLALLERWTDRRDAQAFKEIVSRYAPMVYATCTRILGQGGDAEDVTQECFEVLARTDKRPTTHLGAWLHRVATNRALDKVRSEQSRKARETRFMAEHLPHADVEWQDVYEYLDEAIGALPEELRVPVVAHYLENASHAAIARALRVPRRTVSRRVARGVELIGDTLRKRGVTLGAGALASLMAANLAEATTIPATLAVRLGKLALVHSARYAVPAVPSTLAGAKLLGGLFVMKKAVVGLIVIVAAVASMWALSTEKSPAPGTPTTKSADTAENPTAPVEPTSEAVASSQPAMVAPSEPDSATEASKGPRISGTVVDAGTGEGVAGAGVAAQDAQSGQVWQAVSDRDGGFEIAGPREGAYLVYKESGPGAYVGSLTDDVVEVWLDADKGPGDITLIARKGGTISGEVTDQQGNRVEGAMLSVRPATNTSFQGAKSAIGTQINGSGISDTSGTYSISGLKLDRDLTVVASAAGYAPTLSPAFALSAGASSRRVNFQLSRGSTLSGFAVDKDGVAQPNTAIAVYPSRIASDFSSIGVLKSETFLNSEGVSTDAQGAFVIPALPEGTYRLFAGDLRPSPVLQYEVGGTEVAVDGVHDVGDVLVPVNSAAHGDHFMAGRVSDSSGLPVAGAFVNLVGANNPPETYAIHTGNDGTFRVDGVGSGPFVISVTAGGYSQAILDSSPVDPEGLEIVLNELTHVRGRIVDAGSGKPLSGVKVGLAKMDHRPGVQLHPILVDSFERLRVQNGGDVTTISNTDGTFDLSGVEPGDITLKAVRSGYAPTRCDVSIGLDETTDDVEIRLSRGATVEGKVRTAGGKPVSNAFIVFLPAQLADENQRRAEVRLLRAQLDLTGVKAVSGSDGQFAIHDVADGVYVARAIASDYADSQTVDVTVTGANASGFVPLRLEQGGTLEGFITLNGKPACGVRAEITSANVYASMRIVHSDPTGYFVARHLPPGATELRVVHLALQSDDMIRKYQLSIASGKTTRQDVAYGGVARIRGVVSGLDVPEEWSVVAVHLPDDMDADASPDWSRDWSEYLAGVGQIADDGSYAVPDLADGTYKLFLLENRHPDREGLAWETVEVSGQDVTFDLRVPE